MAKPTGGVENNATLQELDNLSDISDDVDDILNQEDLANSNAENGHANNGYVSEEETGQDLLNMEDFEVVDALVDFEVVDSVEDFEVVEALEDREDPHESQNMSQVHASGIAERDVKDKQVARASATETDQTNKSKECKDEKNIHKSKDSSKSHEEGKSNDSRRRNKDNLRECENSGGIYKASGNQRESHSGRSVDKQSSIKSSSDRSNKKKDGAVVEAKSDGKSMYVREEKNDCGKENSQRITNKRTDLQLPDEKEKPDQVLPKCIMKASDQLSKLNKDGSIKCISEDINITISQNEDKKIIENKKDTLSNSGKQELSARCGTDTVSCETSCASCGAAGAGCDAAGDTAENVNICELSRSSCEITSDTCELPGNKDNILDFLLEKQISQGESSFDIELRLVTEDSKQNTAKSRLANRNLKKDPKAKHVYKSLKEDNIKLEQTTKQCSKLQQAVKFCKQDCKQKYQKFNCETEHSQEENLFSNQVVGEPRLYRYSKVVIIGDSRIKHLEDVGIKSTFGPLEIKCVPDLTLDNLEEAVKHYADKSNCPRGILLICSVGIYDMIDLNNNLSCQKTQCSYNHKPLKQICDVKKHSANVYRTLVTVNKKLKQMFGKHSAVFFTTVLPVRISNYNLFQKRVHSESTGHEPVFYKRHWNANMEKQIQNKVFKFNIEVAELCVRGDGKEIVWGLLPLKPEFKVYVDEYLEDGLNPSRDATENYMIPMLKYTIKQYHMNRYQEVVLIGDSRLHKVEKVWPINDGEMVTIFTQCKLSFRALTEDNPIVKEISGKKDALIVLSLGMYDIINFVAEDGCDSHKMKLELPSLCLENLDSSDKLWNDFVNSLKSVDELLRKVTTNCDVIITTIYPFDFLTLQNYLVKRHAEETGHIVTIPSQSMEIKEKLNRIGQFILGINRIAFTLAEVKQLPVWDFNSLVFGIDLPKDNVPLFDGFHPTVVVARRIAKACVKFADNSLYVYNSYKHPTQIKDDTESDKLLRIRQPDLSTIMESNTLSLPPTNIGKIRRIKCIDRLGVSIINNSCSNITKKHYLLQITSALTLTPCVYISYVKGNRKASSDTESLSPVTMEDTPVVSGFSKNSYLECVSPTDLSLSPCSYVGEERVFSPERENFQSQNSLLEPVSPSSMRLSSPDYEEDKNAELHDKASLVMKCNSTENYTVNYTDNTCSFSKYGTSDLISARLKSRELLGKNDNDNRENSPKKKHSPKKDYSPVRELSPWRYGSKVSDRSGGRCYSIEESDCYDKNLSSPERIRRERCHSPVKQYPLDKKTWRQSPRRSCSREEIWRQSPRRSCSRDETWRQSPRRSCSRDETWRQSPRRSCSRDETWRQSPRRSYSRNETWRQSPRRSCSPVRHLGHGFNDRVTNEHLRQDRRNTNWERDLYSPTNSLHCKRSRSRSISHSHSSTRRRRGSSSGIKEEIGSTSRIREEYGSTSRIREEYGSSSRIREEYGSSSRIREEYDSSSERRDKYSSKNSVIVCTLRSLREAHDEECDMYRKVPVTHPDYTKEFRAFVEKKREKIVSLGGDPYTYDMTKEWEIFWKSRIEDIFNECWAVKRDQCMSLLHNKIYPHSPTASSCSVSSSRSSDASNYSSRNRKRAKYTRSPSVNRKKSTKKMRRTRDKNISDRSRSSSSHYEDKEELLEHEKTDDKLGDLIRKRERDSHYQSSKRSMETSWENDPFTRDKGSSHVANQRLENAGNPKENVDLNSMTGIIDELLQHFTKPENTAKVEPLSSCISNEVSQPGDRHTSLDEKSDKNPLKIDLSEKTNFTLDDSLKNLCDRFPQKVDQLKYTERHLPEEEVSSTTPPESLTDDVIDVLETLGHLDERLGAFLSPVKLLHEKALKLKASGQDTMKIFDEVDNKILLHLTRDKFKNAVKGNTLNIIQKAIIQEAEQKLSLLLEKEKDRSLLDDLNIDSIACACLGKSTEETTTFIENALMYHGHTDVPQDQFKRIHMAVKAEQAKIFHLTV
ncbi:uncharacterized protein [Procambarus clarkii]|uniref:uncharacterized protein n=1 Tax=Procambarus clarkii TaxID=6728 RepID=UPI0037440FDF